MPPDSNSERNLSDHALALFFEALETECEETEHPQIASAITAMLARAREKFSKFMGASDSPTEHAFVQYVANRLPGYKPAAEELSKVHAADLLLAQGCLQGNPAAVRALDQEYLGLVNVAGRRLKMSAALCDELRQQVRVKLLVPTQKGAEPKIGNYAGSGALRSWIYATGLRTGLNELRRLGRAAIPTGDEQLLVAMPDQNDDQELRYMKELYRSAFQKAFRASIATLEDRLSNVLRHYYLDEMTLEEIGVLYRVHKSTVMRWTNKAHAELETETKQRMIANLNLAPGEVESVMRLIQSGIQLGLASVLADKQ